MGKEIERKYLVVGEAWKEQGEGTLILQGYLSSQMERVVRVRTMGDRAYLTIKGIATGATRLEFEYDIPPDDGNELLDLCQKPTIEKTRYKIPYRGLVWEVDEFHGVNESLVIAECELESEDQQIDKPEWVGEEVTGDPRYYNSNLIAHPFTAW
jgi:adenylate cyclase